MNPALSIYLDLVRFGAALVVVLSHVWPVVEPQTVLPWPGHHAVVVFFVLSGIVIAHATTKRALSVTEYAVHRLARLWSVAVPALLLAAAIAPFAGSHQISEVAPLSAGFGELLTRSLANFLFVAQLWGVDAPPALNAPFWSLNYEAWYYVLFGIWCFAPRRLRPFGLVAACAIAGPRILLLMPIWQMGVAVYRLAPGVRTRGREAEVPLRAPSPCGRGLGEGSPRSGDDAAPPLPPAPSHKGRGSFRAAAHASLTDRDALGLAVFLATAVLALAWMYLDLSVRLREWMFLAWPELTGSLFASNQFAGDTALGVLISLHFASVPSLGRFARPLLRLQRPIRMAASYTLSAYLYHMPLLVLLWSGLGLHSRWVWLPLGLLIVALGQVTEHRLATAQALLRRLLGAPAARGVAGAYTPRGIR